MRTTASKLRDTLVRDYLQSGTLPLHAKLPTISELADRYVVSGPTVGKAVELLAAEGWVTKRQGSGIYVAALPGASRLRQRQRRIGCVVQSLRPVVAHRIFEGVERAVRRHGQIVEVATTEWDYAAEHHQIEQMRARGVQGVVLYPTAIRPPAGEYLAREFRDYPIVVVDIYDPGMRRPHLIFDNETAGRRITEFLIAQGRRRIALITYDDAIRAHPLSDPLRGHRIALSEAALPCADPYIIRAAGGGPGSRDHLAALEQVLRLDPAPDALILPEDRFAGVSAAWLRAHGRTVPDEVMVVGFDNLQDEAWGERFPTTQPDFVNMGERAADMLLKCIQSHEFSPTGLILPCPLILQGPPRDAVTGAIGTILDSRQVAATSSTTGGSR